VASTVSERAPDFIYIGTSKAGSTWHFKVLSWHPQVCMYPGKSLGFFSTSYGKGWQWYLRQFEPEPQHRVVGEVSHSYLAFADAAERLQQLLPRVKMLVCLRDPVQRTFSDYLDGVKNGKMSGSFEEELERNPVLIDRSRYGTQLGRFLRRFERSQFHISSFDDLVADPRQHAARMFDFLGVDVLEIPMNLTAKVLPAGTPRSAALAALAKRLSRIARRNGLNALRGRVKTSRPVRNMLYRPFKNDARPSMLPTTEAALRNLMTQEVQLLDAIAGSDFCGLWGYPSATPLRDEAG
jgi:hypothetical protein